MVEIERVRSISNRESVIGVETKQGHLLPAAAAVAPAVAAAAAELAAAPFNRSEMDVRL